MTIQHVSVLQSEVSGQGDVGALRVTVDMTATEWTNFLAASVPVPANNAGTGEMLAVTNFLAGKLG